MTWVYHELGTQRDFCFCIYFTSSGIILSLLYCRTSVLKKPEPFMIQHFTVSCCLNGTRGFGAVAFLSHHSYYRNFDNRGVVNICEFIDVNRQHPLQIWYLTCQVILHSEKIKSAQKANIANNPEEALHCS